MARGRSTKGGGSEGDLFTRALEVMRPGERAGYVCTNSVAQNESREASLDRVIAAVVQFDEAA